MTFRPARKPAGDTTWVMTSTPAPTPGSAAPAPAVVPLPPAPPPPTHVLDALLREPYRGIGRTGNDRSQKRVCSRHGPAHRSGRCSKRRREGLPHHAGAVGFAQRQHAVLGTVRRPHLQDRQPRPAPDTPA